MRVRWLEWTPWFARRHNARVEAGVRGIALDLLFRALFATGAKADDIAREMLHFRRSAT